MVGRELLVMLMAAFVGGLLAKKIKQSMLVGYIIGGMIAGLLFRSSGWLHTETISSMAEIGVIFLMFTLGLEFSFSRLKRVGQVAILGAVVQILGIMILMLLLLPRLGLGYQETLLVGAAFALSSTAIVVKVLSARGEMDTVFGQITVGWLLVQDLAVLPMMIMIPVLAGVGGVGTGRVVLSMLKATALLYAVVILGKKLVPWMMNKVALGRSRELTLVSAVSLCLAAAFVTHWLGLSFALGAFLAGLIVAETSQNHAIFSEIRPVRDVFSVVFFVSLGYLFSFGFLFSNLGTVLLLLVVIALVKILLVGSLVYWQDYHPKTAFMASFSLFQVGEFAFVIAGSGLVVGIIDKEVYSLILTVAILSMIMTPLVIRWMPVWYEKLRRGVKKISPKLYTRWFVTHSHKKTGEEVEKMSDHMVICGYGRVGRYVGRALQLSKRQFVVVDYKFELVNKLRAKGIKAIYGDPTDREVLEYAGVRKASALVLAIPDLLSQEQVVEHALTLNPNVQIFCRSHYERHRARLKALGVRFVVQPEFEASLSMIYRLFKKSDSGKLVNLIKRLKIEHGMEN